MSGREANRLSGDRPTLASVHQLATERANALNLLCEKSMDRQNSLSRRKLQLEARLEALLEDSQKQKWR
jgi:hypothetical protein